LDLNRDIIIPSTEILFGLSEQLLILAGAIKK
jgi:hypothetical protein